MNIFIITLMESYILMKKLFSYFYYVSFFLLSGVLLFHIFSIISDEKKNPQKTTAKKETSSTSTEAEEITTEEIDTTDPDTLPNEMMAWWFMKNKNHEQPSAQEDIDLTKYDAWYIDRNLKGNEKSVYLTFDCGYENGFTAGILDVLKKHNAPAAFFLCKHFIKDQPDLVKRMKKEGHIVGNHTSNHICMPESSSRDIREEITSCANYMKEATGYEMDPFFRPPKGEYSERTLKITKDLGYTTIFWSLAYPDYDTANQPGKDYVIEQFSTFIHPGAIPLLHNVSESNAQALDIVLTNLKKYGYTLESLDHLKDK